MGTEDSRSEAGAWQSDSKSTSNEAVPFATIAFHSRDSGITVGDWRSPADDEMALLEVLLSAPFRGAKSLRGRLPNIVLRQVDADGSLSILDRSQSSLPLRLPRIPVEATYLDVDGAIVHLLLHVDSDQMIEMELFREDLRPVNNSCPHPSLLKLDWQQPE